MPNVPADNHDLSCNGNGLGTLNGPAPFPLTHWSMLGALQNASPEAEAALEKLCRAYWRPLYAFARQRGLNREDAQDVIQEFLAGLLRRQNLKAVQREKGRLRSYLLVSLKHFLSNERDRATGIRRPADGFTIPFDEITCAEESNPSLVETLTADQLYERRWALAVLDHVLVRLENEYANSGNERLFDRLKDSLVRNGDGPRQAQIAADLQMTENAVKQAFHRFRLRYRALLRDEIVQTVTQPGEVEDELQHFIAVLRR